jgi:16S rRNA processing protein RimM
LTNEDPFPLVIIGRIIRPHGLKGEVRVRLEAETAPVLQAAERLFARSPGPDAPLLELSPHRVRFANRYAILACHGYRSREEAERLRDHVLYVHEDDLPALEENEFYLYRKIGAEVVTKSGESLGVLEDVVDTAAQAILQVKSEKGRLLLPAVPEFIVRLDEEENRIVVSLPEGLLDVCWEAEEDKEGPNEGKASP